MQKSKPVFATVHDTLSRASLFQCLSAGALLRLASLAREQRFRPGEILHDERAAGGWIHLILAGRIALSRAGRGHPPVGTVRVLQQGDIIGAERLLYRQTANYTVRALTEVTTIRLSRLAVAAIVLQSPGAIEAFWPALRLRVEETRP